MPLGCEMVSERTARADDPAWSPCAEEARRPGITIKLKRAYFCVC